MHRSNDRLGKQSVTENPILGQRREFLRSKPFQTTNHQGSNGSRQSYVDDHLWIEEDDRKGSNTRTNGRRSVPLAAQHPRIANQPTIDVQSGRTCCPSRSAESSSIVSQLYSWVGERWWQDWWSSVQLDDRLLERRRRIITIECYRSVADYGVLAVKRNWVRIRPLPPGLLMSVVLGQGSAMVIESLGLYYHIECFRCCVCNIPLSSSLEGTDVRVRNHRLHCQNCFSDERGKWTSFLLAYLERATVNRDCFSWPVCLPRSVEVECKQFLCVSVLVISPTMLQHITFP